MGLYLIETLIQDDSRTKDKLELKINNIENNLQQIGASLIEVQVAKDYSHAFFIVETTDEHLASNIIENERISVVLQKEVRLIGEKLADVKRQKELVNYVVEWNLPEHLTMEQYLARKEKNSVHYEKVPEVSFARTYVCEDMTKCLCFYDAPNKELVEKAREVVKAPIDSIIELNKKE